MDEVGLSAQRLAILLKPLVAAIVKEISPKEDDISINAAYRAYGRRWISQQRISGNLTDYARGNRVYLSKRDIECLRAAEATTPRLVLRTSGNDSFEQFREGGKLIVRKKRATATSSKKNKESQKKEI